MPPSNAKYPYFELIVYSYNLQNKNFVENNYIYVQSIKNASYLEIYFW